MTFKVTFYQDNMYQVYDTEDPKYETQFTGRLADCEAFIRLTEAGLL